MVAKRPGRSLGPSLTFSGFFSLETTMKKSRGAVGMWVRGFAISDAP